MIGGTTGTTYTNTDSTNVPPPPPGGVMGKDQFLKLLIAQLQNQDPLSPMQGDQMAAQLAQFSSLEQLQQMNTTLTGQQAANGALLGAIQATAAINTIGHTVVALGDQVEIGGANGATSVSAMVGHAGQGTLRIYNSAGVEVGSRSLGQVSSGKQDFELGDAIENLPDGTYHFEIEVTDSTGADVAVQTFVTGKIDGVTSDQTGIVLTAGGLTIGYGSIVHIY